MPHIDSHKGEVVTEQIAAALPQIVRGGDWNTNSKSLSSTNDKGKRSGTDIHDVNRIL